MKTLIAAVLLLGAAACGDQPAPKPAPAPGPQAVPQPITPAPAPAPQAKAPEAPKPDPNQELAARAKNAPAGAAKIQAAGIDVTAVDGRMALWGTAATTAERTRSGTRSRSGHGSAFFRRCFSRSGN